MMNDDNDDEVISYLIFVISFTQAGFFNSKFLHPKINTHKNSKICIFCIQSGKFYT